MRQMFSCAVCKDSLSARGNQANEAALTNSKTQDGLMHPNIYLFEILWIAEQYFLKHCDEHDAFWKTIDDVRESGDVSFPWGDHKSEALARILQYYLLMRMRQYCKGKKQMPKSNVEKKKKESVDCSTCSVEQN